MNQTKFRCIDTSDSILEGQESETGILTVPNGANYESTSIIIIYIYIHHNNYYYTLDPVDCDCDLPHNVIIILLFFMSKHYFISVPYWCIPL